MIDNQDKAVELLRLAKACLEAAERLSVHEDRARVIAMARRWFALAQEAEAKKGRASGAFRPG